jgi:hypothetical protein
MIGIDHDVWAEGAAIAAGASADIGDLVSKDARDRFKKAFFETLDLYAYRSNQENRDWLVEMIGLFSQGVREGLSLADVKAVIEREARARGLT